MFEAEQELNMYVFSHTHLMYVYTHTHLMFVCIHILDACAYTSLHTCVEQGPLFCPAWQAVFFASTSLTHSAFVYFYVNGDKMGGASWWKDHCRLSYAVHILHNNFDKVQYAYISYIHVHTSHFLTRVMWDTLAWLACFAAFFAFTDFTHFVSVYFDVNSDMMCTAGKLKEIRGVGYAEQRVVLSKENWSTLCICVHVCMIFWRMYAFTHASYLPYVYIHVIPCACNA